MVFPLRPPRWWPRRPDRWGKPPFHGAGCQVCNLVFVAMASHSAAAGQTVRSLLFLSPLYGVGDRPHRPPVPSPAPSASHVCTLCILFMLSFLLLVFTRLWAQHSGFLWDTVGVTIKPTYLKGQMLKSRNAVTYPHSSFSKYTEHLPR